MFYLLDNSDDVDEPEDCEQMKYCYIRQFQVLVCTPHACLSFVGALELLPKNSSLKTQIVRSCEFAPECLALCTLRLVGNKVQGVPKHRPVPT